MQETPGSPTLCLHIQEVTCQVTLPVAVKIGLFFTSLLYVMQDLVAVGRKALVLMALLARLQYAVVLEGARSRYKC